MSGPDRRQRHRHRAGPPALSQPVRPAYELAPGPGRRSSSTCDYATVDGIGITKRFVFQRGAYVVDVEYLVDEHRRPAVARRALFGQLKRDGRPDPGASGGQARRHSHSSVSPRVTADEPYQKFTFDDIAENAVASCEPRRLDRAGPALLHRRLDSGARQTRTAFRCCTPPPATTSPASHRRKSRLPPAPAARYRRAFLRRTQGPVPPAPDLAGPRPHGRLRLVVVDRAAAVRAAVFLRHRPACTSLAGASSSGSRYRQLGLWRSCC
jgi:hypothetical protein